MDNKNKLYERYTSTSSLAATEDVEKALRWSKSYFRSNYLNLLTNDKNAKILEVGCGYGRYLAALAEMGYTNCSGIDLSPEQIAYAKTELKLCNVEEANALEWLNGKEANFDCIICLDVLEHLSNNDLLSLGEMIHKALRPGGTVIFQVPNGMSPLNPIIYGDLTHVRAFTPQSMQQFLLHVGLIPSGYFEIPPYVHNIKSALQKLLWVGVIRPIISLIVRSIHGKVMGGHIYTSNFIAVAKVKIIEAKRMEPVSMYSGVNA